MEEELNVILNLFSTNWNRKTDFKGVEQRVQSLGLQSKFKSNYRYVMSYSQVIEKYCMKVHILYVSGLEGQKKTGGVRSPSFKNSLSAINDLSQRQ